MDLNVEQVMTLTLAPEETLMVSLPRYATPQAAEVVQAQLESKFGTGRVVVFIGDVKVVKTEKPAPKKGFLSFFRRS